VPLHTTAVVVQLTEAYYQQAVPLHSARHHSIVMPETVAEVPAARLDNWPHFVSSGKSPTTSLLALRAFALPQHWTKRLYSCLAGCGLWGHHGFQCAHLPIPYLSI